MRRVFRIDRALAPGRVGKIAFQVVASGTAAGIVGFTMAHRVNREEIALRGGGTVVVAGEQLTLPGVSSQPPTSPFDPLSGTPVPVEISRGGSPNPTQLAPATTEELQGEPGPTISGNPANPTTTVVDLPLGRVASPVATPGTPTTTAPSAKAARSVAGASLGPDGTDGAVSAEPDLTPDGSINDASPRVDPTPPTLVLVGGPPFVPSTTQATIPSPNEPVRTTEPVTEPTFEPAPTIPPTTKATTPTTKAAPTTTKWAPAATKIMTATKAPVIAATTTSAPTLPPVASTTRLSGQPVVTAVRYTTTTAASTPANTKVPTSPTTTVEETDPETSPSTTIRSSASTTRPSLTLAPSLPTITMVSPPSSTTTTTSPTSTTTPTAPTSTTGAPATSTTTPTPTSTTTTTTTTQPPRPSWVEAEDCRLSGDVKELATAKGFTGRGYISLQSDTSGKVDCTIVASAAGRYAVSIHVMSDKEAKISVTQGTTRKTFRLEGTKTDNWSNGEWISVELDFVEGQNTIVLTASEIDSGSIVVDRLETTFKQADQTDEGTLKSSSD